MIGSVPVATAHVAAVHFAVGDVIEMCGSGQGDQQQFGGSGTDRCHPAPQHQLRPGKNRRSL